VGMSDIVKDILAVQDRLARTTFGHLSPEDVNFIRSVNTLKTVPTETVGTTEPLQTERVEYVVALKELAKSYVGPEQVLNSFKEHKDVEFPWIDKPLQTVEEWTQTMKDHVGKELKKELESSHVGQDKAIRYDQNKPQMDLLSPIAMFGLAQVMTHGLKKYPGSQWKKGMAWSKVTASLLRHLFKFMAGEDIDPESLCPHIDHVAANAMFLQEYFRKHKDLDDRMKTGLE